MPWESGWDGSKGTKAWTLFQSKEIIKKLPKGRTRYPWHALLKHEGKESISQLQHKGYLHTCKWGSALIYKVEQPKALLHYTCETKEGCLLPTLYFKGRSYPNILDGYRSIFFRHLCDIFSFPRFHSKTTNTSMYFHEFLLDSYWILHQTILNLISCFNVGEIFFQCLPNVNSVTGSLCTAHVSHLWHWYDFPLQHLLSFPPAPQSLDNSLVCNGRWTW